MKIIKQSLRGLVILVLTGGIGFIGLGNVSAAEFFYNGDAGPAFWWELDPEWSACTGTAEDARQSPIDIDHVKIDRSLKPLDLQTFATTIDIFNNGHTIEQTYEGTGSSIYFDGRVYELQQFHFHTFSEHTVDDQRAMMEMHAVFNEAVSGDNLVIGQLFKIGKKENRFIQTLIDAGLPEKNGDTTQADDLIDLADGLTDTSSYYTYGGSLTTPACTENVTWVVLKKQSRLTHEQWNSFRRILGNNFRPLQNLNDRTIWATADKGGKNKHKERHDHDD
jgi:carbonic anhydrase